MQRHIQPQNRPARAPLTFQGLIPFDVDELPQRVPYLHEVGGVAHDLVDVLVRRRDLVDEGLGGPELDPCIASLQLGQA